MHNYKLQIVWVGTLVARCHSERSETESKNLRTKNLLCRNDNAKILRRGFALLRMTRLGGFGAVEILNYQLSTVN